MFIFSVCREINPKLLWCLLHIIQIACEFAILALPSWLLQFLPKWNAHTNIRKKISFTLFRASWIVLEVKRAPEEVLRFEKTDGTVKKIHWRFGRCFITIIKSKDCSLRVYEWNHKPFYIRKAVRFFAFKTDGTDERLEIWARLKEVTHIGKAPAVFESRTSGWSGWSGVLSSCLFIHPCPFISLWPGNQFRYTIQNVIIGKMPYGFCKEQEPFQKNSEPVYFKLNVLIDFFLWSLRSPI